MFQKIECIKLLNSRIRIHQSCLIIPIDITLPFILRILIGFLNVDVVRQCTHAGMDGVNMSFLSCFT